MMDSLAIYHGKIQYFNGHSAMSKGYGGWKNKSEAPVDRSVRWLILYYLWGFNHPKWRRISEEEMNTMNKTDPKESNMASWEIH